MTDLERMMEIWDGALKDQFGKFQKIPVPPLEETGDRIVIVPESSLSRDDWVVAYVQGDYIVLDDYVPEAFDGTIP